MGMNSPDLYSCQTPKDDVIHYYRTKTRGRRDDNAEMFVSIDSHVKELMKEYMPGKAGRAFCFAERYTGYVIFGANVNKGLAAFCKRIGYYRMDYPDYVFYDTLTTARQYYHGTLPNHQLQTVAAACGYDLTRHHHALADAEACAAIAMQLL